MPTETLDPRFAAYLTTNRDFVDAAIAQAVAGLGMPAGGQALDIGTGRIGAGSCGQTCYPGWRPPRR